MKRFFIFISLHLFLFLLVIAYQAQADDEKWSIDDFGSYVVASVHGEVVWGDKLRFALMKKNCDYVNVLFSFLTYKNSKVPELQGRKVPIRINGSDTLNVADVLLVKPAFSNMAFFVMFAAPEYYPLNKFTEGIMKDYKKDKVFSIMLAKSDDFDPEEYFDLFYNNWKIDKLPEKITEAYYMCTGKPDEVLQG